MASTRWNIADRAWRQWDRLAWAVRKRGLGGAARKAWRKAVREALGGPEPGEGESLDERYRRRVAREAPFRRRIAALRRRARLAPGVTFSLLCPFSAAEVDAVRATVESALAQVHGEWTLLLLPGGDGAPALAERLAREAARDGRIRVVAAPAGGGRAAALAAGLEAASSDWVAILEAGGRLAPEALLELAAACGSDPELDLVYTDEDRLDPQGRRSAPVFKPGWSPDLLLSTNYLGRLCAVRRGLAAGGFSEGCDGAEDYDLALRASERARRVGRVARVLYHAPPRASRSGEGDGGRRALQAALGRRGIRAEIEPAGSGRHRVRYAIAGTPLVSVVVPTRDRVGLLRTCLSSILERSTYRDLEILVVDNGSSEPEALGYLRTLRAPHRVLPYPREFNWSAINNFAAREAKGDHLLFLNNDVEVVSPGWIEAMLEHAQRPAVGAVGAKLLYPDGTVQHAGVVVGIGGFADHAFRHLPGDDPGYLGLAAMVRNCSAVTGACMMVRREVFERAGGFDERLRVAFNDVDFCLRLGEAGYRIVHTPHAVLHHFESATRGELHPRFEYLFMRRRWGKLVARGDPYYNPNLTLDREDFGLDA